MIVAVLLGVLVSPVGASANAGSFAAKLQPEGPAAVGQLVDVNLSFKAKTDATGPIAARKVAMALPAGFTTHLDQFATCDRKVVTEKGPDPCPKDSVVGSAVLSVVVPSLQIRSTSDRAVIINLGGDKLIMWFKATKPINYVGTVDAQVTTQAAPYGPTITWDFTPYTDGSPETRTVSLDVTLPRQEVASSPPPSSGKPTQPKHSRAGCERRARKIKNRKRRKAALRKCRRKSKSHKARAASTSTRAAVSGGSCPSDGLWKFQAQVLYRDGPATHDAAVACAAGAGGSGDQPQPGSGLCIPPLPCPGRAVSSSMPAEGPGRRTG